MKEGPPPAVDFACAAVPLLLCVCVCEGVCAFTNVCMPLCACVCGCVSWLLCGLLVNTCEYQPPRATRSGGDDR
jgi:hypothetical protein